MNSIIDGLLTLSKIRSTKDVNIEPLDMGEIVNQVLARLKDNIDKTTHNINIKNLLRSLNYKIK